MNRTITQLIILARTFADELEAINTASVENTAPAAEQPKRTRGPNKPKETPAPAEQTQTAVEVQNNLPKQTLEEACTGLSLDALQALIKAPVEGGIGKQVKELIAKHGGTKLADLPAAAHEAFKADVEALVY